jgi:CBS domain-containing protein
MNIGSICKRHVVTVDGSTTLQQAAQLMREHHVGAVVVVRSAGPEPHAVGVLTDRDLAIEVLARGGDGSRRSAASLVEGMALVSAPEECDVLEAVQRMQSSGVRRLLVHDKAGGLVGLVSFDDLLPACVAPLAGLAEVLRRGLEREAAARGALAMPPRPVVRVPAMGTAGWHL